MLREIKASAILVLIAAASVSGVATAAVTFSDGNFAVGWSDVVVVSDDPRIVGPGPNTSTGSVTLQSAGGNPGAFRQSTHTVASGDFVTTGGLDANAVYNPIVNGTLGPITFKVDLLEDPTVSGFSAWHLLIQQGGKLYYSMPYQVFSNSTFQTFSLSNLTESDFDTNPTVGEAGGVPNGERPDFSAAGAPITFGYALGNDIFGPGPITLVHGVDNWSVTIAAIPEPGTLTMMFAGLGVIGVVAMRRARPRSS